MSYQTIYDGLTNGYQTNGTQMVDGNIPSINDARVQRLIAGVTMENIFQGLVEFSGRGITDKFTPSAVAQTVAQVDVIRILPTDDGFRSLDGTINNGWFNDEVGDFLKTAVTSIRILDIMDRPIDIPATQMHLVPASLLAEYITNFVARAQTQINGATYAHKLFAVTKAESDGAEVNIVKLGDTDDTAWKGKIVEANVLLSEGDIDNGVDIFPESGRCVVVPVRERAPLLASGVLFLGGSNYGQDIIRKGTLDADAQARRIIEDGYLGTIDGTPCHGISNGSLLAGARYLGLADRDLIEGDVRGYNSSLIANARGIVSAEQFKVVDSQAGQGIRVQPYFKIGVASWYPKGNVLFVKPDYVNYITSLKALFTGASFDDVVYGIQGPNSRAKASASVTAISTTAFTVTNESAPKVLPFVKSTYVYFVGATAVSTVDAFIKGHNGATKKGTGTLGTSKAQALTANEVVNVAVISKDGTITLLSKKLTA